MLAMPTCVRWAMCPLAAGENLHTLAEFTSLISVGGVDFKAVHTGSGNSSRGLAEGFDHSGELGVGGFLVLGYPTTGESGHPHQLFAGCVNHHSAGGCRWRRNTGNQSRQTCRDVKP